MKVNHDKFKIISTDADNKQTGCSIVEKLERFILLGSLVPGSDMRRRIDLASSAFGRHNGKTWSHKDILIKLKIGLFYVLITPIVVYANETWTILQLY